MSHFSMLLAKIFVFCFGCMESFYVSKQDKQIRYMD